MLTAFNEINYSYLKRRQVMIIDSAFPIKSGPRFGSQIRQVEKVDSEQGFRFHDFNFFFFFGVRKFIKRDFSIACILDEIVSFKIIKLLRTSLRVKE